MKNKKQLYILCLLWLSLFFHTGCGKEDPPSYEASISFISENDEVLSRASFVNSTADFDHFVVWGTYDRETPVFTSQRVNKVQYSWEYNPVQLWIMSANEYEFIAYTPSDEVTAHSTNNHLDKIYFNSKTTQTDLLMAYANVQKANFGKMVTMSFKHALAAINFSFKLKEGFTYSHTYKVTGIKWNNVYTEGTFAINSSTITPTVTGGLGETQTLPFTGDQFTINTAMESDFLFVIPQTLASASLIFTLEINGESQQIEKTVSNIQWESGNKYTYSILLDPFEISIQTTPWEKLPTEDIIISSN